MQELTRLARERGWQVAAGRCWEEGGAPAYWPWIQAVRELGGDFERLSPGTKGSVDPDTARFRLFDAAARFLVERSRAQPLVILLDDLHAADAASLVLMRFVGEAVGQAPLVLVGSYREREAQSHERPELFGELARVGPRLALQGLEVEEVEAYVEGVTGQEMSRPAASRLHVLTGGNPFFLGEVLRLVEPEGLRTRGPGQLRTSGPNQGALRRGQHVLRQPEHPPPGDPRAGRTLPRLTQRDRHVTAT
jgi:hypothetical protein